MKFQPRNDWVLIRIIRLDATDQGIAMPDSAIEGKTFHVVAVGKEVEDDCDSTGVRCSGGKVIR